MITLANPSENIELSALAALHAAVSPDDQTKIGISIDDIGGVVCSRSTSDHSILLNRCFVSDNNLLLDHSIVNAVKAFYSDKGIDKFFLHVTSPTTEIAESLTRCGLKKGRSWMKFSRDTNEPPAINEKITVREITAQSTPALATAFADIVTPCFDMQTASIPLLAAMASDTNWRLFLGFDGDTPAATGALYQRNGVAYCDWGATDRHFRQRGFQGALLAARIGAAIAAGAHTIVTATGEDVPGDPQHSYKNILRYGFKENYLRENWMPNNV